MKSATILMKQFIGQLEDTSQVKSINKSLNVVYLNNGDSYKFLTGKMKNSQNKNISETIINEGEFRTAVWNYNPVRDGNFVWIGRGF